MIYDKKFDVFYGQMNGHQTSHIPPRGTHPVKTEIYSEQPMAVQPVKHVYRDDEPEDQSEEDTDDPNDTDYSGEMQVHNELGYRRSQRVSSRDQDRKPDRRGGTGLPPGMRATRSIQNFNEQDGSNGL